MFRLSVRKSLWLGLIVVVCFVSLSCKHYNKGIVKGDGFLSRSLFFKGDITYSIQNIQVINGNESSEKTVAIFGNYNAYIVSTRSKGIRKKFTFKNSIGLRPEFLNDGIDSLKEILMRGGGFGDVGLADINGKPIWKYTKVGTSPVMVQETSKLNSDVNFYIGDIDGLRKFDQNGKQIWKVGDKWEEDVAIISDSSKKTIVLTLGSDGKVRSWDSSGKFIRESVPEAKIDKLEIVKWSSDYQILSELSPFIIIMDLNGKILLKINLQIDERINAIRGVPIKLGVDKKSYLAILADYRSSVDRAMLCLLAPDGQIVYQELLDSSRGLAVLNNDDGSQSLLVGAGPDTVWQYKRTK